MEQKKKGFIFWAPRVLGIIMVLFLAVFSLDVIDLANNPGELILGMLVHNLPSLLLVALLVISWRWDLVGGIIYPLLGLVYSLSNITEHWSAHLLIAGPLILIGVLFLLSWNSRRHREPAN